MLKSASLPELKTELQTLPQEELLAICLRLARFKRDNKELMGFLLFEAHDMDHYTQQIKTMMTAEFVGVNTANVFFAKKTIRKILRMAGKYAKYAGSKELEAVLLIHFLHHMKLLPAHITKAPIMEKLMISQQKKISKLIEALHEDLQYDLLRQLQALVER